MSKLLEPQAAFPKSSWIEYARSLRKELEQIHNILDDPFPLSIYPQLSQLERDIAKMTVIDGMTAQEIADALGCAKSTVNSYRRTVFKASDARPHEWAKLVFDRIREVLKDE